MTHRAEDHIFPTSAGVALYWSALDSLDAALGRARRAAAPADAAEDLDRIEAFQDELEAMRAAAADKFVVQHNLEVDLVRGGPVAEVPS